MHCSSLKMSNSLSKTKTLPIGRTKLAILQSISKNTQLLFVLIGPSQKKTDGNISATKRAIGDPLVSKQPEFRGLFRFLKHNCYITLTKRATGDPLMSKRPTFQPISLNVSSMCKAGQCTKVYWQVKPWAIFAMQCGTILCYAVQ